MTAPLSMPLTYRKSDRPNQYGLLSYAAAAGGEIDFTAIIENANHQSTIIAPMLFTIPIVVNQASETYEPFRYVCEALGVSPTKELFFYTIDKTNMIITAKDGFTAIDCSIPIGIFGYNIPNFTHIVLIPNFTHIVLDRNGERIDQ